MFIILVIVIGLVAWSLHLMQEAVQHREFALMLAGTLVASAAAAMVAVYFLMGGYVGYVTELTQQSFLENSAEAEYVSWVYQTDAPFFTEVPINHP
ncbi:MAG TPA: hypothetical protein V6D13_14060 [Halomicronema sp.]